MKRFLMLVGVAVVAAAMYVAASPASQQAKGPTAKQFKALKSQVTALGHTVKGLKVVVAAQAKVLGDCLQTAIPINQFGDPDGTGSGTKQGYDYGFNTFPGSGSTPAGAPGFFTTGLDVTTTSDTGSVWFVGALNLNGQGATCAADLAAGGSALQHAPSFRPHRP
jgi:hypothetical protein